MAEFSVSVITVGKFGTMKRRLRAEMELKYAVSVWIALIAAFVTLMPGHASKANLLGYYSLYSFAPVSTLICLVIVGAIMWIGEKRGSKLLAWLRSGPPGPPGSNEYIRWRADRDAESDAVASEEEELVTEIGSEADKGGYDMNLWQRFVFRLTGHLYIGHKTREGWKGSLPHYIMRCPIHGRVVTYLHGSRRLDCPRCLEEAEGK